MNYLHAFFIALFVFLAFFLYQTGKGERHWSVRKISRLGLYTAMAIALGIAESLIPDFLLPGMKIGLPNIVILILLYTDGFGAAFFVNLFRVFIVSLLRGNIFSMGGWMSLAGAFASLLGMGLTHFLLRRASPIGISLVGSFLHVSAQILVAWFYVENAAIVAYLPFMLLLAIGSGLLVGIIADRIMALEKRRTSTRS
mgnify:CR=1 FL=1